MGHRRGKADGKVNKIVIILLVIIIILVSVIYYLSTMLNNISNYSENYRLKNDEIRITAESITHDFVGVENKTKAMIKWMHENTVDMDCKSITTILGDLKSFYNVNTSRNDTCIRSDNPDFIYNSKCGCCGELSKLFNKMATCINITSRVVESNETGNEHSWVQVLDENNKWVDVEPRADTPEIGYNYTENHIITNYISTICN